MDYANAGGKQPPPINDRKFLALPTSSQKYTQNWPFWLLYFWTFGLPLFVPLLKWKPQKGWEKKGNRTASHRSAVISLQSHMAIIPNLE